MKNLGNFVMNMISYFVMVGMVYSVPVIIGLVVFFSSKFVLKKVANEKFGLGHKLISLAVSIVVGLAAGIPVIEYWYYSTTIAE